MKKIVLGRKRRFTVRKKNYRLKSRQMIFGWIVKVIRGLYVNININVTWLWLTGVVTSRKTGERGEFFWTHYQQSYDPTLDPCGFPQWLDLVVTIPSVPPNFWTAKRERTKHHPPSLLLFFQSHSIVFIGIRFDVPEKTIKMLLFSNKWDCPTLA